MALSVAQVRAFLKSLPPEDRNTATAKELGVTAEHAGKNELIQVDPSRWTGPKATEIRKRFDEFEAKVDPAVAAAYVQRQKMEQVFNTPAPSLIAQLTIKQDENGGELRTPTYVFGHLPDLLQVQLIIDGTRVKMVSSQMGTSRLLTEPEKSALRTAMAKAYEGLFRGRANELGLALSSSLSSADAEYMEMLANVRAFRVALD
jgi:hypothetical protein